MQLHYSTDEFVEWLSKSLKEHLDTAHGEKYNKNAHIEDLLVTTEAFVSAVTNFVCNCPKR